MWGQKSYQPALPNPQWGAPLSGTLELSQSQHNQAGQQALCPLLSKEQEKEKKFNICFGGYLLTVANTRAMESLFQYKSLYNYFTHDISKQKKETMKHKITI